MKTTTDIATITDADALIKEFDSIIEDAPVDFLGTGSDSRWANKQEDEWRERIECFRRKLLAITVPTADSPKP